MRKRLSSRLAGGVLAGLALAAVAFAQTGETPPRAHMRIADPATLSGDRAEKVYQAIRSQIQRNYAASGDPVIWEYQTWRRYNSAPYRSPNHGERFVNNYANDVAAGYARYEAVGTMPPGAIVIKDSFTVTEHGEVMTGPFFLMEKKQPGFNPASDDWLFMMLRPDGSVLGVTRGRRSENVAFCAECHGKAPKGQDSLYFMPREVRRKFR